VRAVVEVAAGAPSLVERSPVASLLGTVEAPLASSVLVPGTALAGLALDPVTMIEAAQTPESVDDLATAVASAEAELRAMPPVGLVLLGIDYGGEFFDFEGTPVALPVEPSPNRIVIYAQFGGQTDAETAATVIERRLATGGSQQYALPWSEIFRSWDVSVIADRPVVRIVLDPGPTRSLWLGLLFSRDLGFLAW
jgi:hypothetical protein